MLESRLVHTSLMGSNLTAKVKGGCPQGEVLSPLLWKLVADRLLTATNDLGFNTFGFGFDDIVIIVQGKFVHTVREIMQKALNVVAKWAVKEGLHISPQKTAIVPLTNLGATLDSKLNWNQHLQKIIRKVQTTFALVRRTCSRNWGLGVNVKFNISTTSLNTSLKHIASNLDDLKIASHRITDVENMIR